MDEKIVAGFESPATLTGLNDNIFNCPKCGAFLKDQFINWLHQLTGVSVHKLRNGGLDEIRWMIKIAERSMTISGIEVKQSVITEKALEHVEKLLSKRLSEEEREKYEQNIKNLRELTCQQKEHDSELIRKEKEYSKELQAKLNELEAKMKHIPAIKGSEQEHSILLRLEAISRGTEDEFELQQQGTSLGEDILAIVIDKGQEIAKVDIESKKVESWLNKYIDQTRRTMANHKLIHGIIATTKMPANSLNDVLYITKDGIWIVREDLIEFAYKARREFIVEIHRQKLTENQVKKVMELFREKVFSENYQGRMNSIISRADRIETISKQIQGFTEKSCKSLRTETTGIRNEISMLIDENKEIISQVKDMEQNEKGTSPP